MFTQNLPFEEIKLYNLSILGPDLIVSLLKSASFLEEVLNKAAELFMILTIISYNNPKCIKKHIV